MCPWIILRYSHYSLFTLQTNMKSTQDTNYVVYSKKLVHHSTYFSLQRFSSKD